jgi:hypothetical protein
MKTDGIINNIFYTVWEAQRKNEKTKTPAV